MPLHDFPGFDFPCIHIFIIVPTAFTSCLWAYSHPLESSSINLESDRYPGSILASRSSFTLISHSSSLHLAPFMDITLSVPAFTQRSWLYPSPFRTYILIEVDSVSSTTFWHSCYIFHWHVWRFELHLQFHFLIASDIDPLAAYMHLHLSKAPICISSMWYCSNFGQVTASYIIPNRPITCITIASASFTLHLTHCIFHLTHFPLRCIYWEHILRLILPALAFILLHCIQLKLTSSAHIYFWSLFLL